MKCLVLTLLTFFFLAFGQSQPSKYLINVLTVDNQIKDSIETRTIELDGRLFGSINFKLFANDSLAVEHNTFDANSYAKNMSFLNGDTIKTVGFLNFINFGFGYSVLLSNHNTCDISLAVVSELETLKLRKEDPLTQSLIVPCIFSELIIPAMPKFTKGETIYGKINLKSSDYFDVEDDTEIKYRIEITGYYKTEVY